jgi:hypothetical protein
VSRRREEYVGEWLPEPVLTVPDAAADVELAENVSIAMLTVLETLGPLERAVFVLREVFEMPYEEIASTIGRTPAAVRQIGHRARGHVAARRPRMRVDRKEQQAAVEKFLTAVSTGDVRSLMEVLAPDVVMIADGGGLVQAARRPIVGGRKVSSFLLAGAAKSPGMTLTPAWFNGMPGARVDYGDVSAAVSLAVEDGRITRIYSILNPDKLGWLDRTADLTR